MKVTNAPKQTIIKQGYRLTLKTWENDGDNYNSHVEEGLSEPEVRFWVDIFEAFTSGSEENGEIGNMYDPDDKEMACYHRTIAAIIRNHRNAVFSLFEFDPIEADAEDSELVDRVSDSFYDWTLSCGEFFTRVADEWTVEYVPTEIVLIDVSADFEVKKTKRKKRK